MKKILLILSLFTLSNCNQVDENVIKDKNTHNIDNFLENTQSNEKLITQDDNSTKQDIKVLNWLDEKEKIEIQNIVNENEVSLPINIDNKLAEKEVTITNVVIENIKEEIIDVSELTKIIIKDSEIIDNDTLTEQETILEETTSEDIEELIDLLLEIH